MMFKYRFECRSCEKTIEYKEVPLFPACPVCQGALDIEACFDGVTYTPIPHAVLMDQQLDKKMFDFISACSGVSEKEITSNLHNDAKAQKAFYAVKQMCTQMLTHASEGEQSMSRNFHERQEMERIEHLVDNMLNGLQTPEELIKGDDWNG